jgi:hypothetical protein
VLQKCAPAWQDPQDPLESTAQARLSCVGESLKACSFLHASAAPPAPSGPDHTGVIVHLQHTLYMGDLSKPLSIGCRSVIFSHQSSCLWQSLRACHAMRLRLRLSIALSVTVTFAVFGTAKPCNSQGSRRLMAYFTLLSFNGCGPRYDTTSD